MIDKTAFSMFNMPPQPNDPNLVELIKLHLEAAEAPDEAQAFLSIPEIQNVMNLNPVSQRVIINRVLTTVLLKLRAMEETVVIHMVPLLANDGLLEDWITLMKEFVIPFLVSNKVLTKVTNN